MREAASIFLPDNAPTMAGFQRIINRLLFRASREIRSVRRE
jgi:hypothetical protein